jgi:ubiquinone/menaquinone biosynthesis C-methylase UbiE
VLTENERRAREVPKGRYSPWEPSVLFARAGKIRTAARMLRDVGLFPKAGGPCLEIGFGSLGWLGELLCWGVPQRDLHGVELDAARVARALELMPGADLRVGDGTRLPWENGKFRLVVISTVLTSVLDPQIRRQLAEEADRVLAPGGALLWYDFAVNNPRNPNVRRVSRAELHQLFPTLAGEVRAVTLAPPLARLIAPQSWLLATALETLPILRTHLLAVLVKRI